jgi:FMN-dependent NADH-azoreductase
MVKETKTTEKVEKGKIDISPSVPVVSPSKEAFKAFIEKYKIQNPKKYELRREVLEARLAEL